MRLRRSFTNWYSTLGNVQTAEDNHRRNNKKQEQQETLSLAEIHARDTFDNQLDLRDSTDKNKIHAAAEDKTLQVVAGLDGSIWPQHKRSCPASAKAFWNVRHNLTKAGGLLLRKDTMVVPVSLQAEVLRQIHHGHFGEVKSVQRAKSSVYWPGD